MQEGRSDEALMLAYRDGDASAFEDLYKRYRGKLFRYLQHQSGDARIAEDLYHDVWIKVIGARANYEPVAKFSTWLFRIAHNRLIDHYRAQARSPLQEAVAGDDDPEGYEVISIPAPATEQPEIRLDRKQLAARLLEEIGRLPLPQREAFLLSQEADMGLDEIAAATGANRETAKSRLRYALAKLRSRLQDLK
jgi:RNA polymerase sigma-70 factor (ECF subfamily)